MGPTLEMVLRLPHEEEKRRPRIVVASIQIQVWQHATWNDNGWSQGAGADIWAISAQFPEHDLVLGHYLDVSILVQFCLGQKAAESAKIGGTPFLMIIPMCLRPRACVISTPMSSIHQYINLTQFTIHESRPTWLDITLHKIEMTLERTNIELQPS